MDQNSSALYSYSDEELRLAWQIAEYRCRILMAHIPDVVYTLDEGGMIVAVNQAVTRYGYQVDELIGQSIRFLIFTEDRDLMTDVISDAIAQKEDCAGRIQFRVVSKAGTVHRIESDYAIRFGPDGQFLFMQGVGRCAGGMMQKPQSQPKDQVELESKTKSYYIELMRANEDLHREILDRRETERALRNREADLEQEKASLQETNTALRVLLKRREVDKHDFEDQVMYNVKELILPFMDRLKAVTTDERQHAYLSILESNLSDITGPFSRRLSLEFYSLTPSELKVANFIRQGKRSREIASLLGLSMRTIDAYRLSIRRKLRIQNKRVNLRTFLSSIN